MVGDFSLFCISTILFYILSFCLQQSVLPTVAIVWLKKDLIGRICILHLKNRLLLAILMQIELQLSKLQLIIGRVGNTAHRTTFKFSGSVCDLDVSVYQFLVLLG